MHWKSKEILPSHMQLLTYLLEYTVCARIMHTFLLPLYGSIFLPSASTHSVALCWTTKALWLPNEPAHICLQTICNIFYSGVCSDSTTVFTGKSASTCVREQARACARHLIGVPVNWCVSCAERMKTIWKNRKVVSACHVGLKLHVGQDDWLKHGICILLWQLIWTFVLFVSETICTVIKYCRNIKLAESCQTFVGICFVAARFISPRRSA